LLTDRSGMSRRRPLVRVLLDGEAIVSQQSQLVKTAKENPLVVFARERAEDDKIKALEEEGVEVVRATKRDLKSILEELGTRSIQSVLVEGGSQVSGSLVDAGLVNKVTLFIAPKIIGGSTAPGAIGGIGVERMSDALNIEDVELIHRGADIEITGYPRAPKE
jgi:diaminohydroxyphosphoribosylaminopyrimidine deaminase/5-amino-6-(5-phosphoribosylamino)uracil reductase